MTVEEAMPERIHRGTALGEVCSMVMSIAESVGFTDFNLKKAVVSKTTMALWGRKRNLNIDFDAGIDQVIEYMSQNDWYGFAD